MPRPSSLLPALLVSLLLLLLTGCASVQGLRPETGPDGSGAPPPGGTAMIYSQPLDVVFQAALAALPQVGLTVIEANPEGRYILAERGLNLMSNGENVGLYLQPQGEGTRVTVLSRRKTVTNIGARDFAMPVHMQLGAVLGRAGK